MKIFKTKSNPEGRKWPDEIVLDVGSNMPMDVYGLRDNAFGVRYVRHDVATKREQDARHQALTEAAEVINKQQQYEAGMRYSDKHITRGAKAILQLRDPNTERQWRIAILLWAARLAARRCTQPSDTFVEFGSNYGFAAAAILCNQQQLGLHIPFVAIDSFQGCKDSLMTEEERHDTTLAARKAALSNGIYNTSANLCRKNLRNYSTASVIQGWLPDCLDHLPPNTNIRFLHIDLNCASAEIDSFCCVQDSEKLRKGAIIVLDDYGYAGGGETYRAWSKLAKERNLDIISLPTGQGMFVL